VRPVKDRLEKRAEAVAGAVWKGVKYLFLIAASGVAGAYFGSLFGLAAAHLTGEPAWAMHGRCGGWTIFVITAFIGAPFGFVHWGSDWKRKKRRCPQVPPQDTNDTPSPSVEAAVSVPMDAAATAEPQRGIKAALVAPLAGGLLGLLLGGMLGGWLILLYFFVAQSPLGPGGWWPILRLSSKSMPGGFSTEDALMKITWLVAVGTCVVLGAIFGLFGTVSIGQRRYQAFGSSKRIK
jgi:hypothetical protein